MRLNVEAHGEFEQFLDGAASYWGAQLPPSGSGAYIVVEALHEDIRVSLRNLTVANAIRRVVPAQLVVITGVDATWHETLQHAFDLPRIRQLAEAFGAAEVIDIHDLVDRRLAAGPDHESPLTVAGRPLLAAGRHRPITDTDLDQNTLATVCRLEQIPTLGDGWRTDPRFLRRRPRGAALSAAYDTLLGGGAVAFVTSHVDYDQWGLAAQAAQRAGIPVINTQSTGSLKAYALFPRTALGEPTFRAELTRQLGTFFEQRVWGRRKEFHRPAELVAWRSKVNMGRPSWWRAGTSAAFEVSNAVERAQLRAHACTRLGLEPGRPTVAVFNHAVSDALWTNREAFASLADWFEQTAAFASTAREINWLLLDHPSQDRYDRTGFFATVAERHLSSPHMLFRPSTTISKNLLWSVTDLGLTVRGSVSNELPAYGIPVIQAGWSEWSACGLTAVADDQSGYWRLLDAALARLTAGQEVITPEQVERARLWLWFYRAASDVSSTLMPHWDTLPVEELLRVIRIHMRQVEADGEPVFAAVDRMWHQQEPCLTRFPLSPDDPGDRRTRPAAPHQEVSDAPLSISV